MNLQKCEGARALMETNGRAYNDAVAGIKPRTAPPGIAQGANTANIPPATPSQLPARIPQVPQQMAPQMQAATSAAPQPTSSLPARIPPPHKKLPSQTPSRLIHGCGATLGSKSLWPRLDGAARSYNSISTVCSGVLPYGLVPEIGAFCERSLRLVGPNTALY